MKNSSGFTLIEMSVVVIIVGLIIAAAIPHFRSYKATEDFYETEEKIQLIDGALKEFFGLNGRYPCPADPTLDISDPLFGVEIADCRANSTAPCPAGCISTGTRDADDDGNPDDILIGSLPVRTLADSTRFSDFTFADGADAYHNQYTYAVTEAMTWQSLGLSNPANVQLGALTVRDEFNRDLTEPAGAAHYVVVSHGRNGLGAHNLEGNVVGDCDVITLYTALPGPPPPVADIQVHSVPGLERELENCDNDDGRFIAALTYHVEGDDYIDDHVIFNAKTNAELWRQASTNPNFLYNTNFGSVGVNTLTPVEKFDVNGTLRAPTSVTADSGFCDPTIADPTDPTTPCLEPDALGGAAMTQCPAGQVAIGINQNNLDCVPLFPAGGLNFSCPGGTYLTGFSNLGNFTCGTP